jgi:hypothetical protein
MSRADRLLALAKGCRERAEKILARAETFDDADARKRTHRIAALRETMKVVNPKELLAEIVIDVVAGTPQVKEAMTFVN